MKDTITEISYEAIGERYYTYRHKSGLCVFVIPKDFSTSYAILATKYGSIEKTFRQKGDADFITVPSGVAHFLEHKLFEEEDGSDAFLKFAPYGASANAYTTFDETAYLFSCTDNFEASLRVLLSFVTHPHFTDENVKKEQGIIGQEIGMCDDKPSNRLYYSTLQGMYEKHAVRENICGSVASIAKITPDILYRCYRTFYHPSNMVLCVVGNADVDTVARAVDDLIPDTCPIEIETFVEEEGRKVSAERVECRMPVSRPEFMIGIKDEPCTDPRSSMKRAVAFDILFDLLFSKSADLYTELYEAGLISHELSSDYSYGSGYAHAMISGSSDDPDEVYRRIAAAVQKANEVPPSAEDFERARRALYADSIRMFDSVEELGDCFTSLALTGCDAFDLLSTIESIRYEDVLTLLGQILLPQRTTFSVIMPIDG